MSPVEKQSSEQSLEQTPKGWVRWTGLGLFLAILGGVFAVGYISYTLVLKNQLESYATDIWGAKVDIGGLDIGLFPIRLGLLEVAITDPDKPMENVVQFGKVGASLNFYHLVVGRTVIEELAIKDLAFNQPRKTSGKTVFKDKQAEIETKDSKAGFSIPTSAIPDFEDILAREKLETFIVAKKVTEQINALSSDWNKLEKDLPTQQDLADYQQEFNKIMSGDVKGLQDLQQRKKALESLQKNVQKSVKTLQNGKELFEKRLPALKNDVLALKKLPAKDLARLQSKYGLSKQGLSNVTYLLFGDEIQYYVDQAQYWYAKAKPFIDDYQQKQAIEEKQAEQEEQNRAFGTNVLYREHDPEPDFIIKKLVLSSSISWGELAVNVTDINFDQPTSKMPIEFVATLQPKGQTGQLNIIGESNFIQSGKGFSVANITMDNYQIKDWPLSDEKALPVVIKKATNQVRGKITLLENEKMSGNVNLIYQKVDFDLSRSDSKTVKRYIAPIFDDINHFTVTTKIKGKLFSPDIGIRSNLDSKLSNAFNKVIGKEVRVAKIKLTKAFKAKVAVAVAPTEEKLSKLLGEQVSLNKSYQALQDILNKNSSEYVEQEKEKLKNKAKKKAEQKAEKEKEKQRKKVKEKLEREKKKQADKLKNKLKNLF